MQFCSNCEKIDDPRNNHLYNTLRGAGGYSSMQIRKFYPFVRILRTPLHRTFNGCSSPRGTREGRGAKASAKEMQGGRLVWASESRGLQTYDPIGKSNIRRMPHRDIYSLLCILLTITFPGCCPHFRVFISFPNLRANYRKDFNFQIRKGILQGKLIGWRWNCRLMKRTI